MAGPDEKLAGSTTNGSWESRELGARACQRRILAFRQPAPCSETVRRPSRWLEEIGRAEKWVHLEFFQFEGDRTGRRFAEAIMQKAREGVRVLHDWLGSLMVPRSFWRELHRARGGARRQPRRALSSRAAGLRARSLEAPRCGRPVCPWAGLASPTSWLKRSSETRPYRDTSVGVRGPAVADLEQAFAGVWAPGLLCPAARKSRRRRRFLWPGIRTRG